MRKLLAILSSLMIVRNSHAQETDNAALSRYRQGRTLYEKGQQQRNGVDVPMNYTKAFELYQESASLGYPMGEYSLGYMYYKGLGCSQDYSKAIELFRKGIPLGMDNSMYFLGLCLRNGYGVAANKDSATYWLQVADSLGSKQAKLELASISAENRADSAGQLLKEIHNLALPQNGPVNCFVRVPHRLPPGVAVAGRYKGYLIQYDWSGSHVIDTRAIQLELSAYPGRVTGEWVEKGTDSFYFSASLRADSLVFDPVSYGRKDHYSPDSAIGYRLETAGLNLVQAMDAVYLAGNVTMFSPGRGEPAKPMVLALARSAAETAVDTRFTFDRVYPNPFYEVVDVNFSLGFAIDVGITVLGINGQPVYQRPTQQLTAGSYFYRLQLPAQLAAGTYLVQVTVGGKPYHYKLLRIQDR